MAVALVGGATVFNLTDGKAVPTWLPAAKRKALTAKEGAHRRFDIIQDFNFPSAAATIAVSPDGGFIVGTGTYPPRLRVWSTTELSVWFERGMDASPVAAAVLSNDYSKVAILQDDRFIEMHTTGERHYRTRVPRFGRCMTYHHPTAELLVGASGPDVYRLNLEEGRFMASLAWRDGADGTASELPDTAGVNAIAVSRLTALFATAADGGSVTVWDPRSGEAAASINVSTAARMAHATAVAFDESSLSLAAGASDGRALLYDLRKRSPLLTKAHQYGLPVKKVLFHRSSAADGHRIVISADARIVKLWHRADGKPLANIEPPAPMNDVALVSDNSAVGGTDSGMLLVAGEQDRISAYYCPQLGVAPKWASFLDGITDEMEAAGEAEGSGGGGGAGSAAGLASTSVYDDYRFVTREELASMGMSSLIGTAMLRAYMHGYFIDTRLYDRVKAAVTDTAGSAGAGASYEEWRRRKVREAVEATRASGIVLEETLPSVNRDLARRLMAESGVTASDIAALAAEPTTQVAGVKRKRGAATAAAPPPAAAAAAVPKPAAAAEAAPAKGKAGSAAKKAAALLTDSRFTSLFSNPDFAIDEESDAYRQMHPQLQVPVPGDGAVGAAPAAGAAAGVGLRSRMGGGGWTRAEIDSDEEEDD